MEDFFKELVSIYKTKVKIKQLKRKTIENFSIFYLNFVDSNRDTKDKTDKYLKLKQVGLQYIKNNQDLIYSEINK
jgi:hypothetical protein